MKQKENSAAKTIIKRSKKKSLLFKTIAILLPFIFLIILEIILRLFNYGTDYTVFLKDETGTYLFLNPEIGKKYFSSEKNATVGAIDPFLKKKDSNTYRIFVMGESSAAGYPYLHNGNFPRDLKFRLQTTFPDKNIEMINVALTATNSYTLLDFTDAIVEQKPDAVLIYVGHNEYHGTMGIASTSGTGANRFWKKTILFCQRSRLFQLLLNLSGNFKKTNAVLTDENRSLMERMAWKQQVPLHSKLFDEGVQQFDENLDEILQKFNKNNIPVYIGNLVCNKKDIKPFISALADTMHNAEWKKYYDKGLADYTKKNLDSAFAHLYRANQIDSSFALCHYLLGKIAYSKGDYGNAYRFYNTAKELDNLRFRAPEVFNNVLSKKAAKYKNVTLVQVQEEFEKNSPHGIIGNELLLEHVHPNINGYYLMANTFYEALKKKGAIDKDWSNELPEDSIRSRLPVTAMDSIYGDLCIISLRSLWPFNEPLPSQNNKTDTSIEKELALAMTFQKASWEEAMVRLLKYYVERKDYRQALKTAQGLILDNPYNIRYLQQAEELATELNDPTLLLFYLKSHWRFVKNSDLARRLFIASLNADKPESSVVYIDYAIANDQSGHDFMPLKGLIMEIISLKKNWQQNSSNVELASKISKDYFLAGSKAMGKKYFDIAYALDKNNDKVKELQKEINVNENK
jgi:lysophospholipase L1-like esterase